MNQNQKKLFDGSHLINDAGNKLGLKRESVATASVYYHRFFQSNDNDIDTFDVNLVSAASLWIASKVNEEDDVKLTDVVNVFYALVNPSKADDPLDCGIIFWSLKDSISTMELLILRSLQFKVVIDLPHRYLLYFLKSLKDWMDCSDEMSTLFARVSWALLNDYFTSSLCLQYLPDPASIAIAVIQLSLKINNLTVPSNETAVNVWEEALKRNVNREALNDIRKDLMTTYLPFNDESCW